MKLENPISPRARHDRDGIAIIIVLAFVVLLTGLVVAFFSRSVSERQVSGSSLNQLKADALARSAVAIITGDLKQEIALTSSTTAVTGGALYFPKTPADWLPAHYPVFTGSNPIPNLVRTSAVGDAALPVKSQAQISGTAISVNNRIVSRARWNSSYLVPLLSATESTPVAAFTVPDWVLVTENGRLATVLSSGTEANAKAVIGRYAYAIYDEGGLLDVNVAGYPTSSDNSQSARKPALSYADLTQIPPITADMINDIVGWRNYASAQATGTLGGFSFVSGNAYNTYVLGATNGFLTTSSTLYNSRSDQTFAGRQAFLKFWGTSPSSGITLGAANQALQYLGTFSRGLNQPSLMPETGRPKVTAGDGGNDAFGLDADSKIVSGTDGRVNPSFVTVRKGSDPAVKTRFPLSRLKLVTHVPTADADVLKYFGLKPGVPPVNSADAWMYRDASIRTLSQVAAAGDTPNFFELLKASINVGAIGKAATSSAGKAFETYQYTRDRSVDNAILQIGANIIDQSDTDSYPTWIQFNGGNFYGVENLPYLYRIRESIVRARLPDPAGTPGTSAPPPEALVSSTLTLTGTAVALLQPEIWNPHDINSNALGDPASRPTSFRFVVTNASPETLSSPTTISVHALSGSSSTPFSGAQSSVTSVDTAKAPLFYNNGAGDNTLVLNAASSSLTFADSNGTLFREPTLLSQPGVPTNSNLALDGTAMNNSPFKDCLTGGSGVNDVSGGTYIGIYLGISPLRWIAKSGTNDYILSADRVTADIPAVGLDGGVTCGLQYKDASGKWFDYDQKFTSAIGTQTLHWDTGNTYGVATGNETWGTCIDPRTSRFGMPAGSVSGTIPFVSGSTNRPGTDAGVGMYGVDGLPKVAGWSSTSWSSGAPFYGGYLSENKETSAIYYKDPDGITRRAMGAYSSGADGLPLATGANDSRPIVLNRPFQSVAELGHVFSGTPWRNLDMFTVESGFAGLLDVFCLNETSDSEGLVAGKVNLNTRQAPVLQAILAGAYRDEVNASDSSKNITNTIAAGVAAKLVARTSGTGGDLGPLFNVSELVGKWASVSGTYGGFSKDIDSLLPAGPDKSIERYREATVRALSSVGTTRVWNLLIDVIAQSGRYPGSAADATKFMVEGEQRYWVHIAIDRLTGKVIDQQIEVVKE